MCPRCKTPLDPVTDKDVTFQGCSTCFGLFVTDDDLQTYVDKASSSDAVVVSFVKLLAVAIETAKTGTGSMLRHCPTCNAPLDRLAFGKNPLVVLDRCGKHGIWLDRTELKKVVRAARSEAHPGVPIDDDDED